MLPAEHRLDDAGLFRLATRRGTRRSSPTLVTHLLQREGVPEPLRQASAKIRGAAHGTDEATHSSLHFVLTRAMALRLVARLRNACLMPDAQLHARAEEWAATLPQPPEPFLDPDRIAEEAEKIRAGVIGMLHLHRMPTETDVALATVFFMADRAISGETFEPSGGLQQERTITERELFGRAKPERVRRMEGSTIWLIGEHMTEPLAAAARLFLAEGHVGSIVTLTRTAAAGEALRAAMGRALGHDRMQYMTVGDGLEAAMDEAFAQAEGAQPGLHEAGHGDAIEHQGDVVAHQQSSDDAFRTLEQRAEEARPDGTPLPFQVDEQLVAAQERDLQARAQCRDHDGDDDDDEIGQAGTHSVCRRVRPARAKITCCGSLVATG